MEQRKHGSRITSSNQGGTTRSSRQKAVEGYLSRLSSFGPDKVLSERIDEVRKNGPSTRPA